MNSGRHDPNPTDSADPASPLDVATTVMQRVRHLRFMHEGFKVTVLSVELATAGKWRRFQSGFTIESQLEASLPSQPRSPQQLVFDSHANALRHGRADAKRCIADLMRRRNETVAAASKEDQA